MTAETVEIPGYIAGTWDIDPVHSHVGFVARHLMVSKVRGNFTKVEGQIITADNPLESSATATIDMTSFNTGNEQRDGDVKGENFLDVANDPTMTYRTTGLRPGPLRRHPGRPVGHRRDQPHRLGHHRQHGAADRRRRGGREDPARHRGRGLAKDAVAQTQQHRVATRAPAWPGTPRGASPGPASPAPCRRRSEPGRAGRRPLLWLAHCYQPISLSVLRKSLN